MKAQYVDIIIDRGPMAKISKQVLAQEVPLYRETHGAGSVQVLGVSTDENGKPLPRREVDGNVEYQRLANLFGADENGQPLVMAVYGRQGTGGLRRAILGGLSAIPVSDESEDGEGVTDENALEEADADGSGYTNVDEIKAALIDMGVDYHSKAKRADLVELLDAASALVASGGDPSGKGVDEIRAELESAAA